MILLIVIIAVGIPGFHSGLVSGLPVLASFSIALASISFSWGRALRPTVRSNTRLLIFLWLISVSLILVAVFLRDLISVNEEVDIIARLTYVVRASTTFGLMAVLSIHFLQKKVDPLMSLVTFAKAIVIIVISGAIFELVSRYVGPKEAISLYKSRQDVGGWDSYHFSRLSGFFSYPGDFAAICVLALCMINLTGWTLASRIACSVILGACLLYTQSRAGIILLVALFLIVSLRDLRYLLAMVVVTILVLLGAQAFSGLLAAQIEKFDYLLRFYDEIDYYIESSKRASEIWGVINGSFSEVVFGLEEGNIQTFYESEWAGSIARVGIIGSFWIFFLLVLSVAIYFRLKLKQDRNILATAAFPVCYMVVYCLGSAGLSRAKIGILFTVLISLLFNLAFMNKNQTISKVGPAHLPD